MPIKVPPLRGAKRAPQLKPIRERRAPIKAPAMPGMELPKAEFDIGAGPWYYQGKKASSAEFRVLSVLNELGWKPQFQVRKFGGRQIAGGQVLDILIEDRTPPVYIDVRGYYHRGARGEADDAKQMFQLKAARPDIQVLVVWDNEAANYDLLRQRILGEVGARGR